MCFSFLQNNPRADTLILASHLPWGVNFPPGSISLPPLVHFSKSEYIELYWGLAAILSVAVLGTWGFQNSPWCLTMSSSLKICPNVYSSYRLLIGWLSFQYLSLFLSFTLFPPNNYAFEIVYKSIKRKLNIYPQIFQTSASDSS